MQAPNFQSECEGDKVKCNFKLSLDLLMSLSMVVSYLFIPCSKKGEDGSKESVIRGLGLVEGK